MNGGGFVKKWMTVPEVASYFSVSRRYVYTLIERGQLNVINLGGAIGARGLRIESASVTNLEISTRVDAQEYDK